MWGIVTPKLVERPSTRLTAQTEEPQASYRQIVLAKVLLISAVILGGFAAFYFVRWYQSLNSLYEPGLALAMSLICLAAYLLVKSHRMALVAHLLPISVLVVMGLSTYTTIFTPADMLGYAGSVLVAGLLLNLPAAFGYLGASLVVLLIADSNGFVPNVGFPEYVFYTVVLSLILLFVWLVTTELELRAEQERAMAAALAHHNQTLEVLVAERTATLEVEVAERRRAEAELRNSEERYRTVVENQTELICRICPEGQITFVNRTFQSYFNATSSEILHTHFSAWLRPDHQAEAKARAAQRLELSRPQAAQYEQPVRQPDGQIVWIQWVIHPIVDYAKDLVEFLAVGRDVTENKAMAAALQEAKQNAEAASQAKSRFVANMSHEIRTPMNAVIGLTNLLLDSSLNDQQRDFVETIRSSGHTLIDIVNNILDFSKIEAGYLELEQVPFSLHTCIEDTLDLFASLAAETNTDLAYYIADGLPDSVSGDFMRLRQILINLLGNAVKFTRRGEVVVQVDGKSEDDHWVYHFQVRDTGIGIPADKLGLLFSEFSQIDASLTRKHGGTGLGLAISRRLSQAMGGDMWVESTEGEGSIFHFTANLAIVERPSQNGHPLRTSRQRALLVDANETRLMFFHQQMRRLGIETVAVRDGAAALARLRRGEKYDLAIVDMATSDRNGPGSAKQWFTYPEMGDKRIILLTSGANVLQEVGNGTAAHIVNLPKPVRSQTLSDTLLAYAMKSESDSAPTEMLFDSKLAQRAPLRILLAEDNMVNQKVAIHMLKHLGYGVDVAADGLAVLEALRGQPYDLILMDLQMPEMDGQTATRRIRAEWPPDEQPRIVALTAHAMAEVRTSCLAAGMDDCIVKPVNIEELVHVLEESAPIPHAAPS